MSVHALDAQVIFERLERTRARSRATCDRSVSLLSASAAAHRQAESIRQSVANERRAMLLGRTPLFLVCGLVEDEPVEARWVPGHGLMCPSCLRERSEIVVGLEETFSSGEGGPTVAAALDRPLAAMLTVMRAMTRVRSLEMSTR